MGFIETTKMVNGPPALSVDGASDLARKLVEIESRGSDTEAALALIERRYGIRSTAIEHLRHHRAKTCDVGLFAKLRSAYLAACERMAAKLITEIEVMKMGAPHDIPEDISDRLCGLSDQVALLRQQINEARKGLTDGQA